MRSVGSLGRVVEGVAPVKTSSPALESPVWNPGCELGIVVRNGTKEIGDWFASRPSLASGGGGYLGRYLTNTPTSSTAELVQASLKLS